MQVAALQGIASHWRNADGKDRRALTILPTGVGKTITALEACRKAVEKGKRVLWIAHREELVTQPYHAIEAIEHFASALRSPVSSKAASTSQNGSSCFRLCRRWRTGQSPT